MGLTISDIAAKAGVSKATVSRVLNRRPEGVGAETRARIEAIVRETGFQRSAVARTLATGESRTIGLIIPDITNPFYPLLVRGVEGALRQSGYSLLLCNSDRSIEKESDYVRVLLEKGVDGVILDSAASDCDCQLKLLDDKGVPCVLLDRAITGRRKRNGVFVDNRHGAHEAASYLFSRDRRALIFINGPADLSQSRQRLAGVVDAVREKGLPDTALHVLDGDFSLASGYRLTLDLLDRAGRRHDRRLPFDAIFAANDVMAVGALRALKQRGVAVPDEVEVVGFDDIELASLVEPPLTTVSQPTLEMGARSAELLLRLVAGERPRAKNLILKPRLVLRGTTQAPAEGVELKSYRPESASDPVQILTKER